MSETRQYNAAVDLVDRNLEAGRGDHPAFVDMSRTMTYKMLADDCGRMGNLLAAHGLNREARVAMIVLDTVDFPIIFLGAIRAGVIPVALNTLLSADIYAHVLDDCRAEALFLSEELAPVVAPILDQVKTLKHVFVVGDDAGAHTSFRETLAAQPTTCEPADTVADEVAFWLYSSGSTGMPKGVQHVHSSLMETAELYAQKLLEIDKDDVVYSAAKLFFAYGLGNGLTFPLSVGATAILLPGRPTPESVMERLKTHQATMFFGVPTLYAAMLADPACTPENS